MLVKAIACIMHVRAMRSFCSYAAATRRRRMRTLRLQRNTGMTTKTEKKIDIKASGDFEEYVIESLKNDPELASEYLNAAMEDSDIRLFLLLLGHLAKA